LFSLFGWVDFNTRPGALSCGAPGSTVPLKQHSSRELDGDELERMRRYSQSGLVQLDDEDTSLRLAGRVPVTWGTKGLLTPRGNVLVDEARERLGVYVPARDDDAHAPDIRREFAEERGGGGDRARRLDQNLQTEK
jgi:hypothetical protein